MADALFLETGTDRLLQEDGSSLFLLEYSAYEVAVMADSPVAYWRLGEASGTTAIDSRGSNNGTYVASPTLGVAGASPTDADTAVAFNGSTQYITVPDSAALDLGDVFSIECWFTRNVNDAQHQIMDKGATGGVGYTVLIASNNQLRLARSDSGVVIAEATSSPWTEGAWHHIVITKNGATTFIYVDGVDDTHVGVGTNATITDTSDQLTIGVWASIGGYWSGLLDEIALYTTVLTAGRVLAHYNAFPQRMPYSSPMPQLLPQ